MLVRCDSEEHNPIHKHLQNGKEAYDQRKYQLATRVEFDRRCRQQLYQPPDPTVVGGVNNDRFVNGFLATGPQVFSCLETNLTKVNNDRLWCVPRA